MPTEFIPYEGSVNERHDADRANAQQSGLVAAAHEFEDGTGAPLADSGSWDGFSDDGSAEPDHQDADEFEFEADAYDAPTRSHDHATKSAINVHQDTSLPERTEPLDHDGRPLVLD